MIQDRDTIDASYRYCRQMSRRAGSSFHAGFMLLPAEKRRAMWALYAFMRHTDDLADGPADGRSPAQALKEWREALEAALRGERGEGRGVRETRQVESGEWRVESTGTAERISLDTLPSPLSSLPSLADTVRRFGIPPEHLHAVIDGVEMDIVERRYETFDELQQYCERVASAVGLACIHIWGFSGPEAFEPARSAGIALQITNILRDLKEDAEAGRLYLPTADMRECGYSFDDLRSGVINEPFRRLMELEIGRAKQHYRAADALAGMLHPDGRRIYAAMIATYGELLRRIERRSADVLRRRVRISPARKMMILARCTLFPSRAMVSF